MTANTVLHLLGNLWIRPLQGLITLAACCQFSAVNFTWTGKPTSPASADSSSLLFLDSSEAPEGSGDVEKSRKISAGGAGSGRLSADTYVLTVRTGVWGLDDVDDDALLTFLLLLFTLELVRLLFWCVGGIGIGLKQLTMAADHGLSFKSENEGMFVHAFRVLKGLVALIAKFALKTFSKFLRLALWDFCRRFCSGA